jgi:hypothetical protein
MDKITPIDPDRSVPLVDLRRLTPAEREQERERREEARRKRRKAAPEPPQDGRGGIDVRV